MQRNFSGTVISERRNSTITFCRKSRFFACNRLFTYLTIEAATVSSIRELLSNTLSASTTYVLRNTDGSVLYRRKVIFILIQRPGVSQTFTQILASEILSPFLLRTMGVKYYTDFSIRILLPLLFILRGIFWFF